MTFRWGDGAGAEQDVFWRHIEKDGEFRLSKVSRRRAALGPVDSLSRLGVLA